MCERMIENTIFKELMKRINKIIDFLAKHSRLLIKNYHTHIHTFEEKILICFRIKNAIQK